jgi:hypothetical protein
MSQTTVLRGLNREFFLSPNKDNELICIFPDNGSCIWTKQDGKWYLTAAKNPNHIGAPARDSFNDMLDEVYLNLTSQELLED